MVTAAMDLGIGGMSSETQAVPPPILLSMRRRFAKPLKLVVTTWRNCSTRPWRPFFPRRVSLSASPENSVNPTV